MEEKDILVTDTLFIYPEHEKMLVDAGYRVVRLPKPDASEEELRDMIKGKTGYILGGIEKVTDKVITVADKLQVIVFTGAAYQEFIPAWKAATERGIAIGNAPGGNAATVAEYAVTLILAMLRDIFALGRTGTKKFETTKSIRDTTFGIVGMGNNGKFAARYLNALGAKEILYYSRSRKVEMEKELNIKYVTLDELLKKSDVVTLHVPVNAGKIIDANRLKTMKDGAILINVANNEIVDFGALKLELKSGRLRAAYDGPPHEDYSDLPIGQFFCSNSQTAYNTFDANGTTSEMATKTIINILKTGDDKFLVNTDYKKFK